MTIHYFTLDRAGRRVVLIVDAIRKQGGVELMESVTSVDRVEYAPFYETYVSRVPPGNIVEILAEQVAETLNLLGSVAPDREPYRYEPAKWSVREVVGHMIDTERVFAFRGSPYGHRRALSKFFRRGLESGGMGERLFVHRAGGLLHHRRARATPPQWPREELSVRAEFRGSGGDGTVTETESRPETDPRTETDPRSELRRSDRGQNDDWIRAYLQAASFGFLATVNDGQPFLNSNIFFYDAGRHAIYLHTARTGRTRSNLSEPVQVAFSNATMGRLLPAQEALEFSVEFSGVVVFGTGRVVEDAAEAKAAFQMILDRYAPHLQPGRDYRAIIPDEMKRTAVFRIDIETWSGKEKFVDPAFEGAFDVPQMPIPFQPPPSDAHPESAI
jgi:nitroimidazol reductase NimA-like FMN-containing flavoprotein (pyridoxamine 5'-phosphate oxidase superfamily)